tara:strand:+ start:7 stop:426 length:420 start_codon:yes stop_codon:yes gene_type:complete
LTFDPRAAFETRSIEDQPSDLAYETNAAFEASSNEDFELSGRDPVLGGKLKEKAVWVDQRKCIGCTYCSSVATNTFAMEPEQGRARAFRQDGDSDELIQEAIDTCPVDCIYWVSFEELIKLEEVIENHQFRNLGLPPVN